MSLSTSLTFKCESNAFFCKKCWTSANENDYYCLAIRKTLAENLKARHCSHCFQYYLASRVLAFFLIFRSQFIHGSACVRYAHSSRNHVLNRKDSWHVAHIFRRHAKPEEQAPIYSHIHFTSDLDEVLNDPDVKLVVVCTHADSHFEYAKRALEAGKNVLVEKPFTPTLAQAKELFALAKSKGLTVTPYQNRRFDSCFLTAKKAIESGKLGEIVEVESHFDYYRPVAETKPGLPQDGAFYGLGVHTMDQIISLFGRPDHVAYDIRSLRNKANPDDTFEAQLFYGDLKAIVKTSHLVKIDYPKFIVHGKKGSFIKYGIDQQETSLKANIMPGEPGFAADDSVGVLEYVNDEGVTVREEMKPEMGDYGRVYDALYQTITHGAPNYVKESEVLTNLEILERGFEQASPSTVTLAK